MIKFFAIAALGLAFSFAAQAQEATKEIPYIEVTGTAELEIVPDEIFLTITLRERLEGKDKVTVEAQEAQVRKALADISIPLTSLSLLDASASYTKLRWKKDVVTQAQYVLKLGNATQVGKVYEKLDMLKVDDVQISKISHSKIEEYKKETRIMAIKAAKGKADYLLEAIGQRTGKPLIVQETGPNYEAPYRTNAYSNVAQVAMEYDKAIGEGLDFQKIKLSSSIYVKFEIQ